MEIEITESKNNTINDFNIPFLEGYITKTKEEYKRRAFVKPVSYHLISKTGSPWIKNVCPVCQMLGNERTVYQFDKTCPTCNVNLLWEDANEIIYGDDKNIRKKTNNWRVTGFVGESSLERDLIGINYVLTVDYYITRKELEAALYEKYDKYYYIDLELELL